MISKYSFILVVFFASIVCLVPNKVIAKGVSQTDKEKALKYYSELRKKNFENYKKSRWSNHRYLKSKYMRKLRKKKTRPLKKETIIVENPEELKIEIEQNINYYCMSNRKKFPNNNNCKLRANTLLKKCQEDKMIWNSTILKCLKNKL